MEQTLDNVTLTPEVQQEIEHWLAKYPADRRQSAILSALMAAQEKMGKGSLTPGLIKAVADYIGVAEVTALEIATFYSMYEMKSVGKHKIGICTNISCKLRGSNEIVEHFEHKLGVKLGGTTSNGMFTIKEVECLGACVGAPVCQVGDDYHENLTPESVDKLLADLESASHE